MAQYRVIWVIDVESDTPKQAAEYAKTIQMNPLAALNFDIVDVNTNEHTVLNIGENDDFV